MNNELDREALLIYLDDLRTMETILHEDDNKIKDINEKEDSLKSDYSSFEMKKPKNLLMLILQIKQLQILDLRF